MRIDEIRSCIIDIIVSKLSFENCISESMYDEKLLGASFNLKARDLVRLYFEIEKKFNISLPEKDIIEGKFSTINGIVDLINACTVDDKVRKRA